MAYRIEVKRSAQRDLTRLPKSAREAVATALNALAETPRPAGAVALTGHQGLLRLRIAGRYRVVYRVDDAARTMLVLLIGDRKDVYRGL